MGRPTTSSDPYETTTTTTTTNEQYASAGASFGASASLGASGRIGLSSQAASQHRAVNPAAQTASLPQQQQQQQQGITGAQGARGYLPQGGQSQIDPATADRLYRERMEEEYAKREGGA
ncbi:hypothetical protein L228DRAFT_242910 [Xylona heveae TC161]|uniref:Uncharacterized protein n=1 Tax=Xylona heveae (strain CBS 132557 / TC161) TaxID=1328760 RepID=A0A165JMW0_XYLHT|nr:hypothetical protein L228DRAFT_242910 [Xylona heveae TC161]KZF26435.1 hypothetical protein L228DRAFT_242910 [Xylona heveae TC161]